MYFLGFNLTIDFIFFGDISIFCYLEIQSEIKFLID